jgi:hypothetical protein
MWDDHRLPVFGHASNTCSRPSVTLIHIGRLDLTKSVAIVTPLLQCSPSC